MGNAQVLDNLIPELNKTSQVLVVFIFICSTIFIFIQKWKNRHFEKLASKFPGPFALPVIGNALEFVNCGPEEIFFKLLKMAKVYESPFRFWLGHKLCILISKPEDLQIVLNSSKTLEKDDIYHFLMGTVGTGLVTAPVGKWKKTRKVIAPAFSPKIIEEFLPIINERNSILVQKIQQHCGSGTEFDIFPYVSAMALDTICQTAMGVKMNSQFDQNSYFWEALARASELGALRIYKPWLHPDFIFSRTSYAKEFAEANKTLRGYTANVIQKKKKEFEDTKRLKAESDNNMLEEDKLKIFIDIFLELNDQGIAEFSDTDMLDEALTIMVGGSETSIITICFCLLLLAMHPEIQNKVFEEQNRIFGGEDRPVTPVDLMKMEYTEQTIKETLRLFPVVPLQLRAVKEDTKISGDYILPAGATVVIAPIHTHLNPVLWPEPEKFNPDNLSADNLEKKHRYSFIPFSGGPRGCIGYKYAIMAIKTGISNFIRRYEITTTTKLEDIKLSMDLLIRSSNGWNMKLEQRIYPKS